MMNCYIANYVFVRRQLLLLCILLVSSKWTRYLHFDRTGFEITFKKLVNVKFALKLHMYYPSYLIDITCWYNLTLDDFLAVCYPSQLSFEALDIFVVTSNVWVLNFFCLLEYLVYQIAWWLLYYISVDLFVENLQYFSHHLSGVLVLIFTHCWIFNNLICH